MKKITLIAALLGTTYFANAQVGIGTADPATAAELDIVAKAGDKGILIPRVTLTAENVFTPIKGAQIESLLVYNNTASATMPKGFYYWVDAKWNRIIGKAELDKVVENLGDNITNITNDVQGLKNIVNFILPTNPGNEDPTKPGHTTIVYDHTTGDMYEVVYDATTKKYITKKIDLLKMIQGKETNTFFKEIKDASGKTTGYVYFNEKTIVEWLEADAKNTVDNIPNDVKGAIVIDVKGTVVNNFKEILEAPTTITVTTKEGDKTFTTVEEYLQYISQSAEGNVIYKNISTDPAKEEWVFQYYDKTTEKYKTISLRDLVAGTETKTFVREIKDANDKITGFVYFSEQTIIDWLALDKDKNTVDNIPNNAKGAITVDVKGTIVKNIQEILKSKTEVKEGGKTFITVEEYLQYISQSAEGNVIYKNISTDPAKEEWVFQYYDKTTGEYVTIKLEDLVAGFETKTNIVRTEAKANGKLEAYTEVIAPVETAVKKGEIFYKYNNEDKKAQYINMTADIISSITNNEDVKNALTNILNQGGNVYFGDVKGKEVFYTMQIVNGKEEKTPILLPASFILDIINKYKDVVKNALGDHINDTTTIVNTGNTYNGKMVFLAKGSTKVGKEEGGVQYPSPLTTGVEIDIAKIDGLKAIEDVLTVSILKGGKVVASTVADLVAVGNKLTFSIGTGAFYTALPYGEYEVVVEFTGNLSPMTPITKP